jgi:hypothetical protein
MSETDNIARGNHVVPVEWAEQLERERDEAREKYATEATEHMLSINRICNERDEARAVADELSAIAARYLGWHLSRTPMGPDDDHLAQSRRISETLARWKSLASA